MIGRGRPHHDGHLHQKNLVVGIFSRQSPFPILRRKKTKNQHVSGPHVVDLVNLPGHVYEDWSSVGLISQSGLQKGLERIQQRPLVESFPELCHPAHPRSASGLWRTLRELFQGPRLLKWSWPNFQTYTFLLSSAHCIRQLSRQASTFCSGSYCSAGVHSMGVCA